MESLQTAIDVKFSCDYILVCRPMLYSCFVEACSMGFTSLPTSRRVRVNWANPTEGFLESDWTARGLPRPKPAVVALVVWTTASRGGRSCTSRDAKGPTDPDKALQLKALDALDGINGS